MKWMKRLWKWVLSAAVLGLLSWGGFEGVRLYQRTIAEKKVLREIITRLQADSRIAEVLVTKVEYDPLKQRHLTTIKFLEYDTTGRPLTPRYFTFTGHILQFQSLVVRFEDDFVKSGEALRGKSAYLFWKVFMLDGQNTQEYDITSMHAVPRGYKVGDGRNEFEQQIWSRFWEYALDTQQAVSKGIKNAQIEAPGTKFVPGVLYTLKIEHDGGIRIDTTEIPQILRGETIY